MNDGSYVRLHGAALDANQVGFDSADADAVAAGAVPASRYGLVGWFAGRGQASGAAPSEAEQAWLEVAVGGGGRLFFSGDGSGRPAFLANVFSAQVSASSGGLAVMGAGAFSGLSWSLDDGKGGTYDTGAPRALGASGVAVELATYVGGGGAAVGVPQRTVAFGFPFETIVGAPERVEVMRRVLAFLQPPPTDGGVWWPDGGSTGGGGGVGGGGGGGGGGGSVDGGSPEYGFEGGGCSSAGGLLAVPLVWGLRRRRRR
jgi:hypothetical protein